MVAQKPHIPVLFREAVDALNIRENGFYVDATLGRGGHAAEILSRLGESGRLIGFDRDPQAVSLGRDKFSGDQRVTILHSQFSQMSLMLSRELGVRHVDGILMDLGVSSPQLDQPERGFSFMRDGDLDMRMDTSRGQSAAQWLAVVDERELVQVLFDLGEEKFARRIARAIVLTRDESPITSTLQLAAIVCEATPKKDKHKHPATRTFQAIRLYINQELVEVSHALPQALELLNEGGRLAVISFHSLEDRIVKRFIRQHSTPNLPPRNIPVTEENYLTPMKAIGKAIKPSKQEVHENPRSRSSVLRIAERTAVPLSAVAISSPPTSSRGGGYAR